MKRVFLDTNILVDYVLGREHGDDAEQLFIAVLPTDDAQLVAAMGQRVRDFEDMLQYQCAKAAGCDVIVTNNGRDFAEFCNLPLLTATEFLTELSGK